MTSIALFDLDNTLVDRQGAFIRWATEFSRRRALGGHAVSSLIELDEDGFAPREEVFGPLRDRYGLTDSTDDLIAEYRSTYLDGFEPDPAVNSALALLRDSGWRLGIVTNGPPTQREKAERAGLLELVDALCISEVIGAAKPNRVIFDEAIKLCSNSDRPPRAMWMIGDTAIPDIAGGQQAGLRTIWMHRGRRWEHTEFRPDQIAGSIADAVERILREDTP